MHAMIGQISVECRRDVALGRLAVETRARRFAGAGRDLGVLPLLREEGEVDGDAEAEAARLREEELARKREEAERLRDAQINSDMVALRSGDDGSPVGYEDAAGPPGERVMDDETFVRAGANAADGGNFAGKPTSSGIVDTGWRKSTTGGNRYAAASA